MFKDKRKDEFQREMRGMGADMKCKCGGTLIEISLKVIEGTPKKAIKCSVCGKTSVK
jgi:hypothetical protein